MTTVSRCWLFAVLVLVANSTAQVRSSCVRFDAPDIVVCHDVTTEAFSRQFPNDRLIQATFQISAFTYYGREGDLGQFVYLFESPSRTAFVVDYSPKTEMFSEIEGNLNVSKQNERSSSIGISATTSFDAYVNGNGNASTGNRKTESIQYQQKPEHELLAASGTLSRGTAVYFKLRPSTQVTLEGARNFEVTFQVNKDWRSDFFRIRCAAYSGHLKDSKRPICGSTDFLVAAHIAGDEEARESARRMIAAERELRSKAAPFVQQSKTQKPDWHDGLFAVFKKKEKPPVTSDWINQIVFSLAVSRTSEERQLPEQVREAVLAYQSARSSLINASH